MRKLIALLLILATTPAFATFGAASAWDVRTTGVDTNGGAFDSGVGSPGTDESQGSGTAITVTLTGTTTGTGSPAFTSTTHGPGNFVHIASGSGCSTGWFEVLSQAAGVATFDHAMGVATNVCVGTIGGSLLTIAQANTNSVSANTIYIKAGTYTLTTAIAVAQATITLSGYNSTHGDNGTRPLITTATNSTNIFTTSSSAGVQVFNNLSLSNTAGTRANGIVQLSAHGTSEYWVFTGCIFDGFGIAINSDNAGADFDVSQILVTGTEIKNDTGFGVKSNTGTVVVEGSYIHNNGNNGVDVSGSSTVASHSIFAANTGIGLNVSTTFSTIANCTFASNTVIGFDASASGATFSIYNSIFYNNSTGISIGSASNNTIGSAAGSRSNAFGSNTNTHWNGSPGDVTLTANPFTASGSGDYSLNSTAGGGAALKGAGYPGIFPGATSTGSLDIGAVQSAGGGGAGTGNYGVSN